MCLMKSFRVYGWVILTVLFWASVAKAEPVLTAIEVEGNSQVVSSHILGAVGSRVGEELDQDQVNADIQGIYDLGFFSYVDARISATGDGLVLTFVVTENPIVREIHFQGNTVYKEERLQALLFTRPGMIFNRVFFRNDLQRMREQFQADGYVMTRINDVQIENGVVTVYLVEPRVGEIIIQGNRRTKSYVIERAFPLKTGDLFNSTVLRHSIARLRNLGFFSDVNVGFEPSEAPDSINLVITVQEQKSASLLFSVSYGSSSGVGGGVSYRENNLGGRARIFEIGFEEGDYQNYWVTLSDPYMDAQTYSWRIGAYKREDDELTYRDTLDVNGVHYRRQDFFDYDESRTGFFVGTGKKFGKNEEFSWTLTADWHKSKVDYYGPAGGFTNAESQEWFDRFAGEGGEDSLNSKVFSLTAEISRNNMSSYLSYPQGDRQTIGVEQALEFAGGEWDYTKYWAESCFYIPIKGIEDYIDLGMTEDRPVIFAARLRVGFSSGTIPLSERFSLGGANSLRGFESGDFKGHEMALGNFEIRIPIDENFSIVGFYDIGNAWNKNSGNRFDLSDLEDSPGIGVRVKTPLGNIRVDVASGDETEFHFGFGEMF